MRRDELTAKSRNILQRRTLLPIVQFRLDARAVLIFDKIKELMDAEAAILQPQPFSVEELLAMPPLQPDRLAEISS